MVGATVGEAAFLQEEGEEGAERGERLGRIAEDRLRQVPADKRQRGAEPGIAGGLAEAGEEIGDLLGNSER